MPDEVVIPWRWVTPLDETSGSLEALFARLEPYREAWEEFIAQSSEEERTEALQRNLRVKLNHTESAEDRWAEICQLVERTLAVAVAQFGRVLG